MNAPAILRRALRLQSCSHFPVPHLSTSSAVPVPSVQHPFQGSHMLSRRPVHTARPTALTNMLASDVPPPVQVTSVGPGGIKLADGLVLDGPVVFLEGQVFLWDVPAPGASGWNWEEWTREHWEVFRVVVPKPEILIFGTGARMELVSSRIRGYVKELGIQMDVMDTKNACSTYNLLAEEGRRVSAALLPIRPKKWTRREGY